ncbi:MULTISPECIES: hypothetical protein [Amycolatopsis]|uniref:Uncharacterized protein n=1 Tax=Amycolatopsis tolypomycina TaxID=208445 RepID=A0A1H4J4E2_9PSEU|nr:MULTISPECIES: hypothetical protein [Amycolatopsis]SEB41087.1 hypothetical protein SAMN04489727_1505 [Amycolatopsis tolypomycina]HET6709293.1 hypothetical protein [Amycolatopsis sp.]
MYAWLWRKFPGPFAVKLTIAVVLVLGVIALLMFVVFPWLEPRLWFNEVAVN